MTENMRNCPKNDCEDGVIFELGCVASWFTAYNKLWTNNPLGKRSNKNITPPVFFPDSVTLQSNHLYKADETLYEMLICILDGYNKVE